MRPVDHLTVSSLAVVDRFSRSAALKTKQYIMRPEDRLTVSSLVVVDRDPFELLLAVAIVVAAGVYAVFVRYDLPELWEKLTSINPQILEVSACLHRFRYIYYITMCVSIHHYWGLIKSFSLQLSIFKSWAFNVTLRVTKYLLICAAIDCAAQKVFIYYIIIIIYFLLRIK